MRSTTSGALQTLVCLQFCTKIAQTWANVQEISSSSWLRTRSMMRSAIGICVHVSVGEITDPWINYSVAFAIRVSKLRNRVDLRLRMSLVLLLDTVMGICALNRCST
ncbi:hypothetical protein KC19_1G323500 [Ceratodon purpureus]|uniref:Secreted protein n=1 Tax=Ceratodon purpureus TaxID=3225 RepID=A0A8T0JE45_CERPU|nr:hypothetical protein KC19_1G323500 [Ceratodon purpureus]